MNPEPEEAAVNVAHVAPLSHLPLEIRQEPVARLRLLEMWRRLIGEERRMRLIAGTSSSSSDVVVKEVET